MRISALALALLTIFFLQNSQAGSLDYNCSSRTFDGVNFKYCINSVDRTRNQDIVYFFHGISASEKSWFTKDDTTSIVKSWSSHGYEPTVIAVSLGPVWMLVDNERFHYLPIFRDQVLPFLENEIGGLGSGRRLIIGQSMGGFNAAQATFKMPGYFERALLLCPAITAIGPFASSDQIKSYTQRTHAQGFLVNGLINISQKYIVDEADWEKHDVLRLPAMYPKGILKPLYYVSTGRGDNYGFQEGSQIFVNTAKKYGFQAKWSPVFGYHCSFDRQGAADFIRGVSR